jgi:hypothetical protein
MKRREEVKAVNAERYPSGRQALARGNLVASCCNKLLAENSRER